MISARRVDQLDPQLLRCFRATLRPAASPRSVASVQSLPSCRRAQLVIEPIDLWELDDAHSVRVLYCTYKLGLSMARLSVSRDAIAMGDRYGMSGIGLVSKTLMEVRRRGFWSTVFINFFSEGIGVAAPFEIA
jgi:acetyl-CoA acetyltransferase